MLRIRFQDKDFIFPEEDLTQEGSIAFQEDYELGRCSYAHLYFDGTIWRLNEKIGIREDIEILGTYEFSSEFNPCTFLYGTLFDSSWPQLGT